MLPVLPSAPPARRAFTLVELLTVIGILAVLIAILLPVLIQARAKGREAACTSNLRQLGQAMLLYSQDFDDDFPLGGDPTDINSPGSWFQSSRHDRALAPLLINLRPLPLVLDPYVKEKRIWSCPSDTGFAVGGRSEAIDFDTRPSSFDRFGSSYYYYTALALEQRPVSALQAWDEDSPHKERGPADIVVFYDGSGAWHGGTILNTRRYGSLFADGHARTLPRDVFSATFNHTWTRP